MNAHEHAERASAARNLRQWLTPGESPGNEWATNEERLLALPRSERLYVDVVLADLVVQGLAAYAKDGGGLAHVTAGAF